ncbi:MAG: glycosyl hydrolase 115 family protein, partial [Patescibacteria group bacterium]|nr:glycosyl hydrolase 115 family protein [Patescibacteria group bacterium]
MRTPFTMYMVLIQLIAAALASAGQAKAAAPFALSTPDATARIVVPPAESECVLLAAEDLAADVHRITGRRPEVVRDLAKAGGACVLLATVNQPASAALVEQLAPGLAATLAGKWEAFRVVSLAKTADSTEPVLLIAGSDARGTMFGLYAFADKYLGVDPLYFWASYPPKPRDRLQWEAVDLVGNEPAVRYRGWFINDEDLLTEWYTDGGSRDIDYPFYAMVTSPKASRHVFEAALRLRMNLIIPASFVNITNPAEERLVADAVRRGLLVSQHHIEPLGVSGFGFLNYWRDRGETVPYSYTAHPEKFDEVWRVFAARWAKYGDSVVWQLGLRGIADRPLWASDKNAPESMEARGELISRAMARQYEIVRSVDARPNPPATTTLWHEGAVLHEAGHLTFPQGITVVFSDHGPGWEMCPDFTTVERRPDRTYGIYHHQAYWSHGPHLVQAVSPAKIGAIMKDAHQRQSTHYVITNVSNVREFLPGLMALSESLQEPAAFDPDEFLTRWCQERFGDHADAVHRCYRDYFASFELEGVDHRVPPLDGATYLMALRIL